MTELNIRKRSLGINFNRQGEAEVCVWAPLAEKVVLLPGDRHKLPLVKDEAGCWTATTNEIRPGDLYKIVLDDGNAFPDPASLSQPAGVHEASQAIDIIDFSWTDNKWVNHPLKEYILYELHTGTFTPQGTFKGIEDKLDHLADLGINAIEIMPVAQFPGGRNWGYDGAFPFAVQHSYGGPRGLQRLVDACHRKGLAVVLDVVYNHIGPEGNYLDKFAPYFTDKYNTPWGKAINFDDAYCDGVRRYFTENVLMWFRDFHIDALRMDAVHAIRDFSPKHILREMRDHVNDLMKATGRTHYLIIECDLNDPRFINPAEADGFGMDAQWIDEFHHALRVTAGEERSGYYADFEGVGHLAKAYKDAYVFDGQYAPHRHKRFGVPTENPGQQFIVFSQNHDQVGNRMFGERASRLVSFEMQKLMVGAVMTAPYLPMLFMGEEYAESHPFLYFVSHTDPGLAEAVRRGRKEEFAAFQARGEAPDPQAPETFEVSRLQWELLKLEPHCTMLRYYKELIALRRSHPVLSQPDRERLEVSAEESTQVLTLHRWQSDKHALCLMNFSQRQQVISLPPLSLTWQLIFDSADPKWKGSAAAQIRAEAHSQITLQPESLLIYSNC